MSIGYAVISGGNVQDSEGVDVIDLDNLRDDDATLEELTDARLTAKTHGLRWVIEIIDERIKQELIYELEGSIVLTEEEAQIVINGFQTGNIDSLDLVALVDDPDIWIEESDSDTAKSLREGREGRTEEETVYQVNNEALITNLLDIKALFVKDREEALGIVTDLAYRWADLTDALVEALKNTTKEN